MNLLRSPCARDAEIEEAFRTSPSLSYQLLRIVNSAAHGGRGIASILHAIRLVGRETLHRWLSLLFVTSLAARSGVDAELAQTAITRARLCELIAQASGLASAGGPLFLAGLLSALDGLLGMPMAEIIDRIELTPELRAALLGQGGPYGPPLALVLAYESGSWDKVPQIASAAAMPAAELTDLYLQSLLWARERMAVMSA
jgi:EAL and modified HD-GYP domain-containing signal transduction protein